MPVQDTKKESVKPKDEKPAKKLTALERFYMARDKARADGHTVGLYEDDDPKLRHELALAQIKGSRPRNKTKKKD